MFSYSTYSTFWCFGDFPYGINCLLVWLTVFSVSHIALPGFSRAVKSHIDWPPRYQDISLSLRYAPGAQIGPVQNIAKIQERNRTPVAEKYETQQHFPCHWRHQAGSAANSLGNSCNKSGDHVPAPLILYRLFHWNFQRIRPGAFQWRVPLVFSDTWMGRFSLSDCLLPGPSWALCRDSVPVALIWWLSMIKRYQVIIRGFPRFVLVVPGFCFFCHRFLAISSVLLTSLVSR